MNWWEWLGYQNEKRERPSTRTRRAVIALGGGGARGLSHLGVMQAVGEAGIQTERIVGVSIGSLMGGMCSVESDVSKVQAKAIEFLSSPAFQAKQQLLLAHTSNGTVAGGGTVFGWYSRFMQYLSAHRRFNRAVTGESLVSNEVMRAGISFLLPDIDLQDLPIPMSVVCVDLLSGHRIVIESGSLREAVLASMAIPGFYPPVRWGKMLLCDVGVFDSLPTQIARSYANDFTITVDVGLDRSTIRRCDTALDAMIRMQDIGERLLRRHVHEAADIVVRPEVGRVAWFDFRKPDTLIQAGLQAGRRAIGTPSEFDQPVAADIPSLKSA